MKKWLVVLGMFFFLQSPVFAQERSWQLILFEGESFRQALLDGLVFDEKTGSLGLMQAKEEGHFLFPIMETPAFESMVLSWNSLTPGTACVELEARLYHDQKEEWSKWLSWGLWQKSPRRRSFCDEDVYARLHYDTASVLGEGATSGKIQIRGTLKGEGVDLRRLALTTRNSRGIDKKGHRQNHPGKLLGESAYSQQTRHPMMAGVMCSAVTIHTQIALLDEPFLPEEVALNCYDAHLSGYGNWAFSVAFAGEAGYNAYVSYGDEEELLRLLDAGYPLGMSVAYTPHPGGNLAYLEGAPLSTEGHLITLRGYQWQGDELYFIVSDSAAPSDQASKITYKASQLMEAWESRILYVLREKEEVLPTEIRRLPLRLIPVEGGARLEGDRSLDITPLFTSQPLREPGRGLLAYTLGEDETLFYDAYISKEGTILFPEDVDLGRVRLYLMSNLGLSYVAEMSAKRKMPLIGFLYLLGGSLIFFFAWRRRIKKEKDIKNPGKIRD